MKSVFSFLLLFFFLALPHLHAQDNPREFEIQEGDTTYVMKQYIFCLLIRGDSADTFTEAELVELQKGHMENMGRLADEGYLQVAGPFGDDGDWRGIFIFDVATVEEAEELVASDPAIQAGRLKAELRPWWTAKGNTFK